MALEIIIVKVAWHPTYRGSEEVGPRPVHGAVGASEDGGALPLGPEMRGGSRGVDSKPGLVVAAVVLAYVTRTLQPYTDSTSEVQVNLKQNQ